ncbi:MAG: hypothetical protein EOP50_00175 [Sphingobacteriales bacterium]|nr:MAG: hypothetical protein EOP50_00175 [Sphingobacteriales bacterium]
MNSFELNNDDLAMVEEMGGHGFTYQEVAEVVAMDNVPDLVAQLQAQTGKAWQHYRRGFLKNQLLLRQRTMKDAMNGSSPAQASMTKILDDCKFRNTP